MLYILLFYHAIFLSSNTRVSFGQIISNLMLYFYIYRDSSDEGPFSCVSSHTERGQNYICGRGRSSRGANAAGDAPRSRPPHRQEAWKTEADLDTVSPHPPRFIPKRSPGVQPPVSTGTQTQVTFFFFSVF